jgi:dethiobiotin synthetase
VSVVVITGTGTEVGKTVVTAAVAALALAAGKRVAVLKPAQTGVVPGQPGDIDHIVQLAGPVTTCELCRYAEPLAPATAARRSGQKTVTTSQVVAKATELSRSHDLVLIEGAGGLLVRFNEEDATIADVTAALSAPILVVTHPALGTLNATALTAEALAHRRVQLLGLVIGRWPNSPDLAANCNLQDLPKVANAPLLGVLPDGSGALDRGRFLAIARASLSPKLGGEFIADQSTLPYEVKL